MAFIISSLSSQSVPTVSELGIERTLELTAVRGGVQDPEQAADLLRALGIEPSIHVPATGIPSILVRLVCSRCGGSGSYSYNHQDGDRCYGCMGRRPSEATWQPVVREAEQLRTRLRSRAQRELRKIRKAEAAKAEAQARAEAWLEASPYELPLDQWEGGQLDGRDQRTLADLWSSIGKWGAPTEKQAALIGRLAAKATAEAEVLLTPAEGRYVIEGTVVSIRESVNEYGYRLRATLKATSSEGVTLYHVTVPAGAEWSKGDAVGCTATVQPSADGRCGWAKRPAKAYRVEVSS